MKRLAERVKSEPEVVRTLADLNLPHACCEVVDKGAESVLDEIETAILLVATSILAGDGFAYALPNRSKGNQLYVPGARRCCRAQKRRPMPQKAYRS